MFIPPHRGWFHNGMAIKICCGRHHPAHRRCHHVYGIRKKREYQVSRRSMSAIEDIIAAEGVRPGSRVDIRTLKRIAEEEEGVEVVLYWEEDMGREADYERDLAGYGHLPEENRPFISIGAFLTFFAETYAMFPRPVDELLAEIPIAIEITAVRAYAPGGEAATRTLIAGLMPFRDEMEV
jgi:hypothetical protein